MNSDPNKRQIPIVNSKTGQSRLSTPVSVHKPHDNSETPSPITVDLKSPSTDKTEPPSVVDNNSRVILNPAVDTLHIASETAVSTNRLAAAGKRPTKTKPDIETLEQLIEYVYARKGQRVALKPKVQQSILKSLPLDEAITASLMELADKDALLIVPRQLLLISREVDCFPVLRGTISNFVKDVMLRHPIFASRGVQDAVLNLPDGPSMADAMTRIANYEPKYADDKDDRKHLDLPTLRRNAANLLATWFVCNRGVSPDELATLLLDTLWAPAALELDDENSRLRALTEVQSNAAIGLVCKRFNQRTSDARSALADAEHNVLKLRTHLSQLDRELENVTLALETRNAELEALRTSSTEELAKEKERQVAEGIHFRHELEQLSGRLVRRLEESIEMLEVGLSALRNKTPRVEVMIERAEHVVDTLRAERKNLNEE